MLCKLYRGSWLHETIGRQTFRFGNMEVSNFILNIGKQIEERCGLYVNFAKGNIKVIEEWIPEDQIAQSIELRKAKESQSEIMKLPKFNPSFLLKKRGRIFCRVPGCEGTKPPDLSKENKEDLYLCEKHRKVLTNLILERCAKEHVIVNIANYSSEDFNGYTNLIGLLEKAFRHIKKKSSRSTTDAIVTEVFLNTRNFLILINALLNPVVITDVIAVLATFLNMFDQFLHLPDNPALLQNCLTALREVANMVFFAFGVIFPWVFFGNAGSQVGAGVGLAVGFVGSWLCGFEALGILATCIVGVLAGKLIGGGTYEWNEKSPGKEKEQEMIMKYQTFIIQNFGTSGTSITPLYHARANIDGDLSLDIVTD